jgi:hypothetical protein
MIELDIIRYYCILMSQCGICCDKDESERTVCVTGHKVCDECYAQLLECPYCRCGYILSLICQHTDGHDDKMIELSSEEHTMYLEYYELNQSIQSCLRRESDWGIDLFSIVEGDYKSVISDWVLITPEKGISPLYATCIQEAMCAMNPSLVDAKDYYALEYELFNETLLERWLPYGVKVYLSYLGKEKKYEWLTKLNICYVRLLLKLTNGKQIDYLIKSGVNDIENDLYYDICNCVGDEYVVWVMSKIANRIFEKKMDDDLELSLLDKNRHNLFQNEDFLKDEDFLLLDEEMFRCPKENVCLAMDLLAVGNICPCDWFMRFRVDV